MKCTGALLCLLLTQGLAQGGPQASPAPQCHVRCIQVYAGHHSEFEQVNAALDSCIRGCEYFSRIEFQTGVAREPLNTLKNCNYSCEENYDGSLLPACQSGCGFHFDGEVTAGHSPSPRPRSDAPIPIFSRPVSSGPAPSPRGPVRSHLISNLPPLHFLPQAMSEPRALNVSPEERPRPAVVELNLSQLLSKVNSLLPQLSQGRPRVMEISINRNPFAEFQPEPEMNFPELPRMVEGLFGRKDDPMKPFIEDIEQFFGDEAPEDDDVEIFMEKNMFEPEESFFGHKDDDMEPFGGFGDIFGKLHSQFGDMMSSLPQLENLRGMLPFGEHSGGKLTVIKAGPGFHEEKSYDIGPDGEFTEVKPVQMVHDALDHANPMDKHFDSADVEMIPTQAEVEEEEEKVAPVMDVRGLEEQEPEKSSEEPVVTVEEFQEHDLPYLSVLRNNVEEKARVLSEKILQSYRSMAEREYLDNECSSSNLSWSDWVSCLHAKVGVPRWLTAATISLGIIFSIWLCLVIPSTAPKRKVKTVFIKGEKPSAALLKAVKEAEAAKAKEAEASGNKKDEYMVAVINVDLPPTYGDVALPGSPAPSYKSDMAPVPGSPAPSYKSMDVEATRVALEPVHEKKESVA